MRYRFDNVEIDAASFKLRRNGQELTPQRRVFDVLHYLLTNRDRVVSKNELLENVWQGEHVNESAVPWSISHIREALGQTRGSKYPIETVHGRGYRFTAQLEEYTETLATAHALKRPVLPFVGRNDVMQRLLARLSDAAHAHGSVCLISGEAGIGKTRCADELVAHSKGLGFSAWVGRATEDMGTPSFWPWQQILRQVMRAQPHLHDAGEQLLARLATLDPGGSAEQGSEPETGAGTVSGRFWLQHELSRLLLDAAQNTPLLLLIDDLQWADISSLNLLGFIAPELAKARVLIVATQREDMPQAETARLARWLRHAERFHLLRLTAADVGNYIAQASGTEEPPLQLSLAVHRATTGNPLFLQETVRTLLLEHGAAALRSLDPSAVKVPEVARDVLRVRLSVLSQDVRALLACAGVLGESFELPLLQALCGVTQAELLQRVDVATEHGSIVAETPQRYRFSHALMRALSYEDITMAERVALHRKAACALEALQTAEPRYAEIAHHYYRSLPLGEYAQVVAAVTRAARAADRVLAHEDAARYYDWALEAQALDPTASPRERAELLFARGRAQRHSGRRRDARDTLQRSIELARQHGYSDLLVRAARMLRPQFAMSRVPDALVREALDEVLRIAEPEPNAPRILALSQLACVPPYADDMLVSKRMSAEALTLARRLGERSTLIEALRSHLYSLSGPDDIDALLAVVSEILELDAERPTVTSLDAHIGRVAALMYRGEHAAAGQALEALGQQARHLRLSEAIWYYDLQLSNRACLFGDFAGARAACPELKARSARLGLRYGELFTTVLDGVASIEQNGLEAYMESFDTSILADMGPNPPRYLRARLVRRWADRGKRDMVVHGLDAFSAQGFEAIPKDIGYLNTLANISLAVCWLGDSERAEQLYALLAPYPRHNTPDMLLFDEGCTSRYLALLAARLGWHTRVAEHFETALAMNRSMRRTNQVAATCYDYAVWLARQPGAGNHARARELAHEARTTAEGVGMRWMADLARSLDV